MSQRARTHHPYSHPGRRPQRGVFAPIFLTRDYPFLRIRVFDEHHQGVQILRANSPSRHGSEPKVAPLAKWRWRACGELQFYRFASTTLREQSSELRALRRLLLAGVSTPRERVGAARRTRGVVHGLQVRSFKPTARVLADGAAHVVSRVAQPTFAAGVLTDTIRCSVRAQPANKVFWLRGTQTARRVVVLQVPPNGKGTRSLGKYKGCPGDPRLVSRR